MRKEYPDSFELAHVEDTTLYLKSEQPFMD